MNELLINKCAFPISAICTEGFSKLFITKQAAFDVIKRVSSLLQSDKQTWDEITIVLSDDKKKAYLLDGIEVYHACIVIGKAEHTCNVIVGNNSQSIAEKTQ